MSLPDITRREFTQGTLASLLTFSFLETVFRADAFGAEVKPIAAKWIKDLNELGLEVKADEIEQVVWQKKVEELLSKVELPELMKFLDFDKLTANIQWREQGERSLRPKFPKVEGLPTDLVFGHQVFALKKDRSVVPHGHDNMCTAFLVMQGEFHGRHYDRLEDTKTTMLIRPTIDGTFKAGQSSTISEHKDNVHWFKATSETGFIFNIHVLNVHRGGSGRVYVDPNGEKRKDGTILAQKRDAKTIYKMYG